jgi:hypothetical protein
MLSSFTQLLYPIPLNPYLLYPYLCTELDQPPLNSYLLLRVNVLLRYLLPTHLLTLALTFVLFTLRSALLSEIADDHRSTVTSCKALSPSLTDRLTHL